MRKKHFKIIWGFCLAAGLLLACESISAFREDLTETRGTAGAVATQAQGIITQAKGIATQLSESNVAGTARAIATEKGPVLIATGESLATLVADEGYVKTVEALVTSGSNELLPTFQAVATQYLSSAPPPDDVPIVPGVVENLLSNKTVVSYTVDADLMEAVDFYRSSMPELDWVDVSNSSSITGKAAVLKFFKPEKVATITLTSNVVSNQTMVLITLRNQ